MPLVLQIENIDRLPDGGPMRIVVGPQGCQVGRNTTMHWVLPDPSRMISGHHFDISFADGGWWLTDRSTNGTFLQGSRYRLDQPYRLRHLDRFQVGHYLIVALIEEPAAAAPGWGAAPPVPVFAPAPPGPGMAPVFDAGTGFTGGIWNLPGQSPAPPPAPAAPPAMPSPAYSPGYPPEADPWGGMAGGLAGGAPPSAPFPGPVPAFTAAPSPAAAQPAPAPVPPPAPQPSPFPQAAPPPLTAAPLGAAFAAPVMAPPPLPTGRMPGQPGDFADDFISTPQPVAPPAPPSIPEPVRVAAPPPPPVAEPAAILRPPMTEAPVPTADPLPISLPPQALSAQAGAVPVSLPPQAPAVAASQPPHRPMPGAATASTENSDLMQAFCIGAGLDPTAFEAVEPEVLARMLGRSMRLVAAEIMTQLQLRAAAKQFTRGGDRTMRTADHNNPLKFMPDVEQALEAMFLRPRAGFLQGPEALQEALLDLRRHQVALFAALQPALTQLLGDLAPEEIEASAGGGLLGGSRKTKAWEIFVERWDAKAAPHENGILDAFLTQFAAAYMDSVAAQSGRGQG